MFDDIIEKTDLQEELDEIRELLKESRDIIYKQNQDLDAYRDQQAILNKDIRKVAGYVKRIYDSKDNFDGLKEIIDEMLEDEDVGKGIDVTVDSIQED